MSIWKWPDLAANVHANARVTLGEGDTPLLLSKRIGPSAGLSRLYLKFEGSNPTGSYKDRFAAMAVSDMLASGRTRCVATSSGNTGAALAAYCAAAGITCEIAVVETAPESKLRQMLAYGARIYRVRGFGLDADITRRTFERLRRRGESPDAALQISAYHYSPVGMTGVQSIAYELAEQLECDIDHVFCPAGGGGLTLAVARGFESLGRAARVACVQPAGNDTIAGPLRNGESWARNVVCTSQISGLQVPGVIDGNETLPACRRSGGNGHVVSDDAVWEAQARLSREEGAFCEPAGATALAGALQAARKGEIASDAVVVCLVTGSGFKDVASVDRMVSGSAVPLVDVDDIDARREIGAK